MSDVLVLCYHAVSPAWPAVLSVTPARLEAQLGSLVARGWRGVTFPEAVLEPPRGRVLAVTFDDAYRSVYERSWPVLRRLGLPGTVFVPTAHIGCSAPLGWPGIERWSGGPHAAELTPMSWDDLGELAADGWEIGSHTCTHAWLPRLDDAQLHHELADSRAAIATRLGRPCRSIAYPYGAVDARVAASAAAAGYTAGAALCAGYVIRHANTLCWPRIGVYHRDGAVRFTAKASVAVRRLRAAPAVARRSWA
jgi:peptidoglycan/xylan/chitin deacetylase (PgdA/CDA1 family)